MKLGRVIQSKKPSGTFVKVRLIRPWKAKPEQKYPHPPGQELVVQREIGEYLADNGIGAILCENLDSKIVVPSRGLVRA